MPLPEEDLEQEFGPRAYLTYQLSVTDSEGTIRREVEQLVPVYEDSIERRMTQHFLLDQIQRIAKEAPAPPPPPEPVFLDLSVLNAPKSTAADLSVEDLSRFGMQSA